MPKSACKCVFGKGGYAIVTFIPYSFVHSHYLIDCNVDLRREQTLVIDFVVQLYTWKTLELMLQVSHDISLRKMVSKKQNKFVSSGAEPGTVQLVPVHPNSAGVSRKFPG